MVRLQPGLGVARTVTQIAMPLLIGGAIGAIILDGINWVVGSICLFVLIYLAAAIIDWNQRASIMAFGRWQERNYVMASIKEAFDRGMSPMEWMDSYVDRVFMEAGIPIPTEPAED